MIAAGGQGDRAERAFGAACVLATAFVVYASLVPLAYAPQPLDVALARFWPPPLVETGAFDRADWLANLVMFAPLSFAGLAALGVARSAWEAAARATAVLAGFLLVAIAIEIAQLWFPPRSVTMNDLVAEAGGIAVGGLAWAALGARVLRVARPFFADAAGARTALALAFVATYVVLALFPFDVVLSAGELADKLAGATVGLWIAPSACTTRSLCVVVTTGSFVAALAFGVCCRLLWRREAPSTWVRSLLIGLVLGAGIELAQSLLVSGVAQGLSGLVRAAGVTLGFRYARRAGSLVGALQTQTLSQPVLVAMALGYIALLALSNRIVTTEWLPFTEALERLAQMPIVPFYYHYYVTEQRALASAIVHLAMYAPIGAWLAIARRSGGRAASAWIAAFVALVVEALKLLAGRQADPTDLLLAAMGAYVAHALVRWLLDVSDRAGAWSAPRLLPHLTFGPLTPYGFVLVIVIVLAVLAYPGPRTLLSLALAVYALALARDPGTWLIVVPALLPVLDLGQWTGALYLDEFDLFVMTTLAVLCFRRPREGAARWPASLALALVVALVFAAIGFARGVVPFTLDPDTFASVHSTANAWRVGRGMAWCAALLLLVRRWSELPERDLGRWSRGMTIGLALVGLVMVWERGTFAGFGDFGIEYRAVGALAAASTAGAQTEAFLAAALPFALLVASTTASPVWRAIALAALLLAAYGITATVSRAAIVAAGAAVFLFGAGLALRIPLSARARRSLAYMFPGTVLMLAIAGIVAGERFSQVTGDFAARRAHWQRLVEPSAERLDETLLGHGLGAYPRFFYFSATPTERPSLFSFRRETGLTYLRLSPGRVSYLDQIVEVEPHATYTATAAVRTTVAGDALVLRVCAKWILYSVSCDDMRMEPAVAGAWQTLSAKFTVRAPPGSTLLRATEKLSLAIAPGSRGVVDVTGLRLLDDRGVEHVRNGSFAIPGAHWLVSAGEHWAWNTFSLFVEVVFEQGWLGLAALAVALAYVFTAVGRRATEGDLVAAAFGASLAGYLLPSLFDALIDEPRMRLLLGLLVALPLLTTSTGPTSPHDARAVA